VVQVVSLLLFLKAELCTHKVVMVTLRAKPLVLFYFVLATLHDPNEVNF